MRHLVNGYMNIVWPARPALASTVSNAIAVTVFYLVAETHLMPNIVSLNVGVDSVKC